MNVYEPMTVLLFEDTRDDEQLALRAFRECGLPLLVRVARDGEQALSALGLDGSSVPKAPDLVISDLKMPKLNGDEVLRRTRADGRLKAVPFVIFSSSDGPDDVRACLALGASAYVTKPVDYERYLECAKGIVTYWLDPSEAKPHPACLLGEREASNA